ncbi:hypothetical protein G7Y89_g10499 [Cudoniella acicularis]|uniref:Uncharacterized protein n=1 Tax=Cudoniella acicularis TaxID=354080 RepID=A0A8H4REZ1_9HELO|nr:hypothetical protein G7Y89_g10499 [Cudoniella acicularis]
MSAPSAVAPTSPLQHRDIRSASLPFKRDKDHGEKWSNGIRPSGGVSYRLGPVGDDELVGGSASQKARVRPQKQWSQMFVFPHHSVESQLIIRSNRTSDHKPHTNKAPKQYGGTGDYCTGKIIHRLERKVDAIVDANDHTSSPLSKSLLELLPQHVNNTKSPIHTAIQEASDVGVLYSFDSKGRSPTDKVSSVALGGLVEQAEVKWLSEQTDKIVKGEYEVLDNEGETTILSTKSKKKGSPKQRAAKNEIKAIEEDDGFELI